MEIVMRESFTEINEALTKSVHRAAKDYGDAVIQYGRALTAYSKGEEDITDLAKTCFNLAFSGAQGAVENGFAFSEAYYRWAFSMFRINPLADKKATPTKTASPTTKPEKA
jgi:hypothetical protein